MKEQQPVGNEGASWRWHALFLMLILLELAAGWLLHRDQADLKRAFEEGSPEVKVRALQILANRNDPRPFDNPLPEAKELLLREFTMTSNVTRLTGRKLQRSHVSSVKDQGEAFRGSFLIEHAVGVRNRRIRLDDVSAWYDSLDMESPGIHDISQ